MSTTRKVLLWILGMLLVPPILGIAAGASGAWGDVALKSALFVYGLFMVAMAVAAAMNVTRSPGARVGMFFVFTVGMVFLQCAVFFVGCSAVLVSGGIH
jgi:hypothetical protein